MAALGYWPREGLFFSTQPQEGAAMASVYSSSPSPAAADGQGGGVHEELQEDKADKEDERGNIDGFNQTETVNGTTSRPPPRLSGGFPAQVNKVFFFDNVILQLLLVVVVVLQWYL
ncbi:hypothetical protein CgunFtcFv8_015145 [Champsocephalus gunnari]|uniref:Uncharacterized protein n=1 Tax=Champsocephalus gunnari TaxID=52237 RepID=A0AAN8C5V3_CHAGU|nr:hypothetical protein CgunFtcFv8_015145 [Champsocephalus gunnari]